MYYTLYFKETTIITALYHLHKTYSSKPFLANNFLQIGEIGKRNENLETYISNRRNYIRT